MELISYMLGLHNGFGGGTEGGPRSQPSPRCREFLTGQEPPGVTTAAELAEQTYCFRKEKLGGLMWVFMWLMRWMWKLIWG